MTILRIAAALAASACTLAASVAAADTHWVVSGTFDDGTTLSGYFNINVYDQLSGFQLNTQTGPVLAADVYQTGDPTSAGATILDFQPTYEEDLELSFANPVGIAASTDPLLTTSYECVGSYGCEGASGGERRYIVSGVASAPEPAAWALMLLGIGGLGMSLRARRGPLAA